MQFFLKAVITGFGLSLGGALYKRVEKQLGLDPGKEDREREREEALRRGDAAIDPELQ